MEIELNHIRWVRYNGALVPDAPPHANIELSRKQARALLRKSKAFFLRWTDRFDCGSETEWWYLIRDKRLELDEFSSKRRRDIEKGLQNCIVRKTDAQTIARDGYEIYKRAFDSYDTFCSPDGPETFYQEMISRKDDRVFDFWAVFDRTDEKMIGYFMNRLGAEACVYSSAKFIPEYLKLGAHQALVYEMTNFYLKELGLKYVCAGARSISHKTNVQDFLIQKLHFRKAFCRLNVIYNPWVRLAVHLLYPFEKFISRINTDISYRITVLLRQEKIRRSFMLRGK